MSKLKTLTKKIDSAIVSTKGLKPKTELFHDEWITVYPTELPLSKITYWPENDRTKFTFDRLERIEKKKLAEIPFERVVDFVTSLPIHELDSLSRSIERNGVRVPMIILDDATLLDGNRRFFASHLLRRRFERKKQQQPQVLDRIPVWVIKTTDLNEKQRLKILAEANFVPDLKIPWPFGAKAKVVEDYYTACLKSKLTHEKALAEIAEVFAMSESIANQWLETLQIANEFVSSSKTEDAHYKHRQVVEEQFVYFWEFRNKAMKGRSQLNATELPDTKRMFFHLMAQQDGFQNLKQVEPMIRARRDSEAWSLLKESKGTKLEQVVAMMNEKRALRAAEDKARLFLAWIKGLPAEEITSKVSELLEQIAEVCSKCIKKGAKK
ncbi:MAG: hypothetical protein H0X66_03065 [Verrucomicrobia bacterium]|nr:hypothetical protein [Verrucomicrobiota bacterium]